MLYKLTYHLVSFWQDVVIWVVSNSDIVPFWTAMFKIFSRNVWVASIFCYILTSVVIRIIGKFIPNERIAYKQIAWIALSIFGMLTGTGPSQSPRAFAARILVFIWAVFSFYWISSFTTILISMITTPQYLRNVCAHSTFFFFFNFTEVKGHSFHSSLDQQHWRYPGQTDDNRNGASDFAFLSAWQDRSVRANNEAIRSLSKYDEMHWFSGQESVRFQFSTLETECAYQRIIYPLAGILLSAWAANSTIMWNWTFWMLLDSVRHVHFNKLSHHRPSKWLRKRWALSISDEKPIKANGVFQGIPFAASDKCDAHASDGIWPNRFLVERSYSHGI